MRISVFIASSIDGYIATNDDDLTWLESAGAAGEDYGFDAFLSSVDALAMGRGTYDHISHLDPLPFGERPVFVFTSRPPAPRAGVTFWQAGPQEAARTWRERGFERIYLDGGKVISDFLAAGLVDDMLLTTVPLLLGEGRRLFHPPGRFQPMHLVSTEVFGSGMVNRRYTKPGD